MPNFGWGWSRAGNTRPGIFAAKRCHSTKLQNSAGGGILILRPGISEFDSVVTGWIKEVDRALLKYSDEKHPRNETAYVRPPGNAAPGSCGRSSTEDLK